MSKLLLLLLLGVLLYVWLTRARRPRHRPPPPPEAMVRCAHCGMHMPLGDSVAAGDEHYCCEEHRRLGHD